MANRCMDGGGGNSRNRVGCRREQPVADSLWRGQLAGVDCDVLHVEHEQIYQAIIDAAEARRCDLIVMASHGRRGVSAVVLGSETVKVLTHSKIPVLVYR